MATMVNPIINHMQVKDSRWLTLEVCREFTRNKCTRTDTECKFAHPPPHVEVQNGRVTCCFDSIKGKCQRKDPPCKYLHPPQHLREQLLQNGKNNLILKNLQMQAMAAGLVPIGGPVGVMPPQPTPPYLTVQSPAFSPYIAGPGQFPMQPTGQLTALHSMDGSAAPQMNANNQQMSGMLTQTPPAMTVTSAKTPRPDRLESGSTSTTVSSAAASEHTSLPAMTWTTAGYVDTLTGPTSHYPSLYLQGMSAVPGVGMPIMKRPAMADKSGIPMYQPGGAAAYQQAALAAMSLQQQPFVPVTIAGHHPSVQRF